MNTSQESKRFDALKHIPDAVVISDAAYRVVFWNRAAETLYGIPATEALGSTIDQLVEVISAPTSRTEIREFVKQSGSWRGEAQHKPKGGQAIWVDWSVSTCELENNESGYLAITRDISQQKRAEEARIVSEAMYRSMIEHSSDVVFCVDRNGEYKFVNQVFASTFGKTPDYFLGKTFWDIYPKEHADQRQAASSRVFATGESQSVEVVVPLPYRTLYFIAKANPVKDEKGLVVLNLTHATDITERKQAEAALQESERLAHSTVDALSAHVAILDETGAILTVNRAWRDFSLSNASTLVGLAEGANYLTICNEASGPYAEGAAEFAAGIRSVLQGKQDEFLTEYPCHSCTEKRWFIGRVTRFQGDGAIRLVIAHENITARKQAEEALLESKRRSEFAVRSTNAGVWDWDIRANLMIWDERMLELYGLTREQFPGGIQAWENGLHPEDRARAVAECERALKGEQPFDTAFRVIRPDGTVCHIKADGLVLRDTSGAPLRMIGLNRDITESKHAEEALHASEAQKNAILNGITTNIALVDKELNILWANKAAANSVQKRPEEMVGQPCYSFWGDGVKACTKCPTLMAFQTGRSEHIIVDTPDGRTWDEGGEPVFDADGNVNFVVEIAQDITESKRAAEALKAAEARTRSILGSIADTFYSLDNEWRFVALNPSAEKAPFGRPASELLGKVIWDLYPGLVNTPIHRHYLDTKKHHSLEHYEGQSPLNDHWYEVFMQGWSGGVDVYMRDITERKQAEEALQKAHKELSAAQQAAHAGIWTWDLVTEGLSWTPELFGLFGLDPQTASASFDIWRRLIHPEDCDLAETRIRDAIRDCVPFESEYRIVLPSGEIRWIRSQGKTSYDAYGKPLSMAGVCIEISERKWAEEQLEKSHYLLTNLARLVPGVIYQYRLYPDGRSAFPWSSPGMNDIYEVTPEDVREDATPVFGRLHPEDYDQVAGAIQESARTLNTFYCEFRVVLPRQGLRWRWSQAQPERTSDGGTLWHGIISDITDRKQAEEALRESDRRVREKLDAVLSPEGDLGSVELADIIDTQAIQDIMDNFYVLTHIGLALLDNSGKILVATGWQDICTKFHRVHPETYGNCNESDTLLSESIEPGTFKQYRCKNNMWDIATPIAIGGRKLGKLFLGQFFYEDETVDVEAFRAQAKKCGFNEDEYLAALARVPRFSRETIRQAMDFYIRLAALISKLSYGNLKLARSLEDRQRAAEELARTNNFLDSIIENIPAVMFLKDARDLRFVRLNKLAEDVFGHPRENMLRKTDYDFFTKEQADFFTEYDRKVLSEKEAVMITAEPIQTRLKGTRILQTKKVPILNAHGEPEYLLGISEDITERKEAEELLRATKENLDLALHASNMGVWQWNIKENRRNFDEQTCRLLGLDFATFKQTEEEFFGAIHPDDHEKVNAVLSQTIEHGAPYDPEYRVVWPDGSIHHVCSRGKFFLDDQGRPLAISGLIWDITDRKQAEGEKAKLEGQLQQAMKMEAIGRLAGGVAHDFNNLLTGITGNISLALMDMKPDDPLAETLTEVNKAADSAAALTRQLLAFSRKQIIEPKVLDLNDIISPMHKMLVRLIGEHIELKTVKGKRLGSVKADPGQFEQILVNLAVNARDAMLDGGTLVIETGNVDLDAEYCQRHSHTTPGEYVMLAVSDTGQGMTEEVKSHLFEPFFTTKAKGRGTGLGLATIYGAVKQAGGCIEVYSEEGQGTTFKIYLPRVAGKAEKLEKDYHALEMPGGTETILLVEDEGIVRDLAIRVLKRLGYNVLHAPDGGKAFILAEEYKDPIDVLMTDVVMPGMNGRQLAERLIKIHPEMKTLYTSGYTENIIVHHGVVDKNLNFIGKPYSPQALAKKLRAVLGGGGRR